MSVMIASGLPVGSIAETLAEEADGEWRKPLSELAGKMLDGSSFADAVQDCSVFPPYAKRLVKAGEESGHMEEVTEALASYYDSREQLRLLADGALVQPLILLSILAVILAGFTGLILPIIGRVYRSLGGSASSYMSIGYAVGIAAFAVIAAALLLLLILRGKLRRKSLEQIKFFKKGRLKELTRKLELASFMSDFETRVSGGILLDYAFADAANAVEDEELKNVLTGCSEKLAEGESLAGVLAAADVFPKSCMHLIGTGIRNGRMEEALARAAELLQEDARTSTEVLVMKLEPMLTGFFTVAVGISLLSVMLPLIAVVSSIG